jgi:hypothetical protein
MRRSRFLVAGAQYLQTMEPTIDPSLRAQLALWTELDRGDQVRLAHDLRRTGLSFREVGQLVPVPKSTVVGWCRGIELTEEQIAAITERTRPPAGTPRDTQRKRRSEIERIRRDAALRAPDLLREPLWVAGVALYWGEGSKTSNELALSNGDPRVARLFVVWTRTYIEPEAEFVLKLNLHASNDEPGARIWWTRQLDLGSAQFHRTYVKTNGTGHRKNHLPYGVCLVRMRRSTDAFHTAIAWIDALAGLTHVDAC